MSIELMMLCNHLILYHLLILLLPSVFPSIRVFSDELAVGIRLPEYWSFSFSISPSNEYSGLISFRVDWFDLLTVQRILRSLIQHPSSKPSVLQHSAFFMVQLSHPYMATGKTIALTRQTFVGKVMPLLFNMLPRFVITFLPRSKRLLISWLQSPLCSDFGAQENKVCHCFPILSWPVSNYCWQFVGSSFLCIFLNLCHARYVILASFLPWLYVESILSH